MIAFTGSTEVGKLFLRYAGESNMKRVSLECGGKSPHIVLPDCRDLAAAATAAAWGVFYNQGEVCNAGTRLVVARADQGRVHGPAARGRARHRARATRSTRDTTLGAMVDETQTERVLGYIETGRDEGADLVLGGSRVRADTGGFYIEPTVFDRVRNDMRIAREEIFGPVLATIDVGSEAEAIAVAQRHDVRPRRGGVDRQRRRRAPRRAGDPRRRRVGQHVRRRRHHEPVRRLQAVRASAATSRSTRSRSTPT